MAAVDDTALASRPKTSLTTDEKLALLEEKFAALEKRYNDLHEKAFTITETATGKVTEIAVAQVNAPPNGVNPPGEDSSPPEKDTGPKSRARIVVNRTDPATGERKDQLLSESASEVSRLTDVFHAFTLRKVVYDDVEANDSEVEITNQGLWDLLKELLSHHPYHVFRGTPVTLYSPFEALVFNWDKLEQATKKAAVDETDRQARLDLRLLLDILATASGDAKLDKYFKTRESNKEQKTVTYDTLWTLFPPGTLVYGKPFQGQDQVFVVQDNTGTWPSRSGRNWTMLCRTYDWDGKMFKRLCLRPVFEHFDGHKPITALPYYPFDLHDDQATIKERLIKQGKIFREACTAKQGSRMFDYSGSAIFDKKGFSGLQGDDDKEDDSMSRSDIDPEVDFLRRLRSGQPPMPSSLVTLKSSNVDSRVMVDFESYFRYGPASARVGSLMPDSDNDECACSDCRDNEELRLRYRSKFDEENSQRGTWDDEQYMLCPPRVLGYILRDKQWAQLQVTSLKIIPEEDSSNSWSKRLKLSDGEETKTMILDLVNSHGKTDSADGDRVLEVDDIVANKGKGLVILLYGPPGVGKTSTAETVAIAARKPLFSISVADVGTKAKNVEANLAKIFALATSWQAILLIDEADVFLESRGKGIANNTERNALVSVFLRVLEYYQGILVLTTNQIAQFDVAVQSRIHIAIKYGNLNREQTLAIFEGFLEPLAARGLVKDMDDIRDWLKEDVCKMGLDGRQIRNIVTSALGLARAQGKNRLEKKNIKRVLSNVKDFKDEFIRQFENYKTSQGGMVG